MAEVPQPSISLKSFACPHCGAHADQSWHALLSAPVRTISRLPYLPAAEVAAKARQNLEARGISDEERMRIERVSEWADKMGTGAPFLDSVPDVTSHSALCNVFVSSCFTCQKLAVWVHDAVIYPAKLAGPIPNQDLPENLQADYEEARKIVNLSPRGAAALLRLTVQKLCVELGEKGKNIDDDIAALVAKGLDPLIQQALDVVRVIGNQAVHPGLMDLRDDRDTALVLFDLVNDIAAHMISRPKRTQATYAKLPQSARDAIEKRDGKGK